MPIIDDLSGRKFGKLTVIQRADNDKDGHTRWLCRCDCGNEKIVFGKCLKNGHTKSCGCLNKEITSSIFLRDLTGYRFGRLVVISRTNDYISPKGKHHVRWLCRCDCGNTTVVESNMLTSNHTKSCGCLHKEKLNTGNVKHGGRNDRLYKVWSNIKNRCYNKNSHDYQYYGGRGIQMCDAWRENYALFKNWAYNSGYDDTAAFGDCTIDRINVNGNYDPKNCRWVNMSIQSNNRRNVKNKQ